MNNLKIYLMVRSGYDVAENFTINDKYATF